MIRISTLILLASLFSSCTYYLGPNRWAKTFNNNPIDIPQEILSVKFQSNDTTLLDEKSLAKKANQKLITYSTKFEDTILDVRVAFAKLLLQQDLDYVNESILQFKAWGTTGTSGKLNKKGDYDFSQIQFINLVWYFKQSPDILYPATATHIINHLVIDNGSKSTLKAPNTMGLIRETENHILMKEISRYLKNQWLYEKDQTLAYNNQENGMTDFLKAHLEEMKKTGFYEFNANPYISYTFEALHVLYNHSEDDALKQLAKEVMDAENWQYALGSFQFKKYGPFRRRMSRESITSLFGDRHGVLIRAELAKANNELIKEEDLPCCFDKTVIPATSSYLLPISTKAYIENTPSTYYAKIGHGLKASPEIYFGTPSYLLSAGGLRFGKRSQIVPRPLSLFLDDDATDIQECFHIKGKGKLNKWNNTGLYQNLMVGESPVHIPEQYAPFKTIGIWEIYQAYADQDIFICVYSQKDFGVLYVGDKAYEKTLALNQSVKTLKKSFSFSSETQISYNVSANKKWVLKETPEGIKSRKFKKWQRFEVSFKDNYSIK